METLVLYGDSNKTLAGKTEGADQSLDGIDGAYNLIYGDALRLAGQATGGDDTITGGSDGAINWIYGDAYSMQGLAVGGDDIIIGGMNAQNYLYGDARTMVSNNVGGKDFLSVGQSEIFILNNNSAPLAQPVTVSTNRLYGDAQSIFGGKGGEDTLSVAGEWVVAMCNAAANVYVYADAAAIESTVTLTLSDNNLIGDAQTMVGSTGGSDILSIANGWSVTMDNADANAYTYGNAVSAAIESTVVLALSNNNLFGDAQTMVGSTGGIDILSIANEWTVTINNADAYADTYAFTAANAAIESTVTLTLSDNNLFGDAQTMVGSTGGIDILSIANEWTVTMDNADALAKVTMRSLNATNSATAAIESTVTLTMSNNNLFGDAQTMVGSTGGIDILSIANEWTVTMDNAYAAASLNSRASATAAIESTVTLTLSDNNLFGDAQTMVGSTGGIDILSIANEWTVTMDNADADTYAIAPATATADAAIESTVTLTLSDNNLFGDAQTMVGSTGGSDILSIANEWTVTMDNAYAAATAIGNTTAVIESTLILTLTNNNLFGDAYTMTNSIGGNDILSIATGWETTLDNTNIPGVESKLIVNITDNMLVGDAHTMSNSKGGDDTLSGADFAGSTTYLTGDGIYANSTSKGGNDTLISGKGNDSMWGDFGGKENTSSSTGATFGQDMFVFMANNGQDIIYDFHRGDGDKIKLHGIDLINATTIEEKITTSADGLNNVISFDDGSTITVIGVTDLAAGDFVFA